MASQAYALLLAVRESPMLDAARTYAWQRDDAVVTKALVACKQMMDAS
jgi:hypothetical protein